VDRDLSGLLKKFLIQEAILRQIRLARAISQGPQMTSRQIQIPEEHRTGPTEDLLRTKK